MEGHPTWSTIISTPSSMIPLGSNRSQTCSPSKPEQINQSPLMSGQRNPSKSGGRFRTNSRRTGSNWRPTFFSIIIVWPKNASIRNTSTIEADSSSTVLFIYTHEAILLGRLIVFLITLVKGKKFKHTLSLILNPTRNPAQLYTSSNGG